MISAKGKKNGMITQKKKRQRSQKSSKNLNVGMGNFVQNTAPGFLSSFLLDLEENILVDPKRKHPSSTNFPFSVLSNQTPTKNTLHYPLKPPQPNGPQGFVCCYCYKIHTKGKLFLYWLHNDFRTRHELMLLTLIVKP